MDYCGGYTPQEVCLAGLELWLLFDVAIPFVWFPTTSVADPAWRYEAIVGSNRPDGDGIVEILPPAVDGSEQLRQWG